MKTLHALLFLLLALPVSVTAAGPLIAGHSRDGGAAIGMLVLPNTATRRIVYNAKVRKAGPATVEITHNTGTTLNPVTEKIKIPAWEFTEAQQRTFGFDPAEVAKAKARAKDADATKAAYQSRIAEDRESTQKARRQREQDVALTAVAREQIAAENRETERREAPARERLAALLQDESAWRKDPALKRLHDLNLIIGKAVETLREIEDRERTRALLMATPADRLAAATIAAHPGRFDAASFAAFSSETKRQIEMFAPEKMPEMPHTGQLGAWEAERDRIRVALILKYAEEIRQQDRR